MSADIDIEVGVPAPESSPSILLSVRNLSEDASAETKTTTIQLELEEILQVDCDESKEEAQETDGLLLASQEISATNENNPDESFDVHQVPLAKQSFSKKRGSTIDVVNCDETTEASETGSLSGGHLSSIKGDDVDAEDGPTGEGEEDSELFDFREMAAGAMRHAEELVRRMLLHVSWTICHFHALPKWLQDNDFIWQGYRPPLPSFWDCIKSIFSIHTETGNIWTHMLGNKLTFEFGANCLLSQILINQGFFYTFLKVASHSLAWARFF